MTGVALIGPAIDPTPAGPAIVVVSADSWLDEPLPPAPPLGPGDPDVEFDPVPAKAGPLVQVLLGRAITREVIGELVTADVEDWDTDVELLAGYSATITASATDPLWPAVATSTSMGADGRPKYRWDPKGLVVWIYEDGICVWTGLFRQPVNLGGGVVQLPAQGPQEVFGERILGRAEQLDLLADRGSFEGSDPLAGWVIPDGVTAEVVDGGVRGHKCLRVKGAGWIASPRVPAVGANGYGRAVVGSTFGSWDDSVTAGTPVILTWTQRADSLVPSNRDVTLANVGTRPDDSSGWTDGPVGSGTRMTDQAVPHAVWVGLHSFADVWSYYDLVTIRESVQTGVSHGAELDLARYVPLVHKDLVARHLGGSPTGLTVQVKSLCGVTDSKRWSHASRTFVHDVFSSILDADGGPECRITTNWVLEVHGTGLGTTRTDIGLSVHDLAGPGGEIDPGAQIDDYIVDTGRGNGVEWISATVSTPTVEDRWRTVAQVTGPTDRSLNEIESWARAHARAAARLQETGQADVPWAVAKQISDGDIVPLVIHDGDQAVDRQVRILRHRWQAKRGRCLLTWGNTEDA